MLTRRRFALDTLAASMAVGFTATAAANKPGDARMHSELRVRIEHILRGWDAIEDHRTGTTGDRRTAEWLAAELRNAGVEASLDGFPFTRRVLEACRITAGGKSADGVPCFDGGLTGSAGVTATLAPLEAGNGIGVAEFDPGGAQPSTRALFAARRAARHTAIVAIASGTGTAPGLTLVNADSYTEPYGPPVLQVATRHREWLTRAANEAATAHLVAHATLENVTAYNVQATIRGRRPELAPLIVMTPRSGWWVCTAERGGGIVVWLEAARRFGSAVPDRTVVFTANTGHELGHVGLHAFTTRHAELVQRAHAWVHLGANFAAVGGRVRYQASDEVLMAQGVEALERAGHPPAQTTPVGTRPYGEARDVFDRNGRYVSLLGENRLFHHPEDRWPAAVDVDKTTALALAMVELVEQLARA